MWGGGIYQIVWKWTGVHGDLFSRTFRKLEFRLIWLFSQYLVLCLFCLVCSCIRYCISHCRGVHLTTSFVYDSYFLCFKKMLWIEFKLLHYTIAIRHSYTYIQLRMEIGGCVKETTTRPKCARTTLAVTDMPAPVLMERYIFIKWTKSTIPPVRDWVSYHHKIYEKNMYTFIMTTNVLNKCVFFRCKDPIILSESI